MVFLNGSDINRPAVAISAYAAREFLACLHAQDTPGIVRQHREHDDGPAGIRGRYLADFSGH